MLASPHHKAHLAATSPLVLTSGQQSTACACLALCSSSVPLSWADRKASAQKGDKCNDSTWLPVLLPVLSGCALLSNASAS